EFSYRAIAIYALDGEPIGYSEKFVKLIPNSVEALNRHPNWLFEVFQHRAPFGFIPSRLTEFGLGMMAGFAAFYKPRQFDRILFSPYAGYIGFGIWLASQTLLYVGLWGWIFADCAISFGLIIWLLNFARFCQKKSGRLFQVIATLGIWSYYIYLTHHPFARLFPQVRNLLLADRSSGLVRLLLFSALFALTLVCIGVTSWLLAKFDRSQYPEIIMSAIVGGFQKIVWMGQLAKLYGLWILVSLLLICSVGSFTKFAPTQFEMSKKIENLKKQQHRISGQIDDLLHLRSGKREH
ncbi:hypothetical protein IQ235_09320, partial [Oscillatoriales cyanobacterium LEGE 11467]